MPDDAVVVARDLAFRADGRTLFQTAELALPGQGITVILGPNGAGKSVLLRLLHGLLPVSDGSVTWPGRDAPPRQAMVFQRPVLLRRSVAANVAFALRASGRDAGALAGLLDRGGLTAQAHQAARSLSGGEQQRLALVRALATEPEILFLDEPTASLDPAATLAIEELIRQAASDGTKIVMVTHNIAQARRLADHLVFCNGGQVTEAGPAQAILGEPESQALRDFLEGRLRP